APEAPARPTAPQAPAPKLPEPSRPEPAKPAVTDVNASPVGDFGGLADGYGPAALMGLATLAVLGSGRFLDALRAIRR
ncbi:MAG: hypothetical protein QM634_13530, partial [Gordonia sp. (in: high G+C Gram-positive bacteria)]